jgi:RNA polymerase sigma factor (sigma-70 family)
MKKAPQQLLIATPPAIASDDEKLVQRCCQDDQDAWNKLVDRYKGLIYSVPVKQGFRPEDAADIFQSVCVELFTNLSRMRNIKSLRSWLVTVTLHKCFYWKKQQRRQAEFDALEEHAADAIAAPPDMMNDALNEVRREQAVRDALEMLPPRCAELIRMLFFEQPPVPYKEAARRMGLAAGSIGFIRGRCLHRLQKILRELEL